jgi:hypothetical protein
LLENYLVDGGRMIIGPYWYEKDDSKPLVDSRAAFEKLILAWGIIPTGYIEKTHYNRPNLHRKALWFDKI